MKNNNIKLIPTLLSALLLGGCGATFQFDPFNFFDTPSFLVFEQDVVIDDNYMYWEHGEYDSYDIMDDEGNVFKKTNDTYTELYNPNKQYKVRYFDENNTFLKETKLYQYNEPPADTILDSDSFAGKVINVPSDINYVILRNINLESLQIAQRKTRLKILVNGYCTISSSSIDYCPIEYLGNNDVNIAIDLRGAANLRIDGYHFDNAGFNLNDAQFKNKFHAINVPRLFVYGESSSKLEISAGYYGNYNNLSVSNANGTTGSKFSAHAVNAKYFANISSGQVILTGGTFADKLDYTGTYYTIKKTLPLNNDIRFNGKYSNTWLDEKTANLDKYSNYNANLNEEMREKSYTIDDFNETYPNYTKYFKLYS